MDVKPVVIGGIPIPFDSPVLLAVVGIHVIAGLVCVVAGIIAMLGRKGPGRHPVFGRIYYKAFIVIFITAAVLSMARWREDYYLLIIGTAAFACAAAGQAVVKPRGTAWRIFHIAGMGMSFVLLLTAFYLDNGRFLPVWKDLPRFTYWLLPNAAGIPLIIYALVKYRGTKGLQ